MTDKELKQLGRQELLKIVLSQEREIAKLRERLRTAESAQYLENIQNLSSEQKTICAQCDVVSRLTSERWLAETEALCQRMEAETREKCVRMLEDCRNEKRQCF